MAGPGSGEEEAQRGCVRLGRERLEVLFVVSDGHKRADLFQMCGLGCTFEKDAQTPEGLLARSRAMPSLLVVALTLLSYWKTRYEMDLSCPGT
jgi:hypothetical protein